MQTYNFSSNLSQCAMSTYLKFLVFLQASSESFCGVFLLFDFGRSGSNFAIV